jgi:hypothetical protein
MLQPVGLAPDRVVGGRLASGARLSVEALSGETVVDKIEITGQPGFRYRVPEAADAVDLSVAGSKRISSTLSSVWSKAATPTTHSSDRPYLTKAAGPSRNSPLPIETPSAITPGPTALNQLSPVGLGAFGSSAILHASSPVRASGAAASFAVGVLIVLSLQHNALVVFFELLVWFYLCANCR